MQEGEKVKNIVQVKYKVNGYRCDQALCLTIILINTKRQLRTFTNQRLEGKSLLVVDKHCQRRNMNGMSVPA